MLMPLDEATLAEREHLMAESTLSRSLLKDATPAPVAQSRGLWRLPRRSCKVRKGCSRE